MIKFFFYQYSTVKSEADLARVGKGGFYVTQDGGYFYVFADEQHANNYGDDALDPFCFFDSGIDPVFGDFKAANEARRIAHNALCTYGAVQFEGA
jgi:hypothetical protein